MAGQQIETPIVVRESRLSWVGSLVGGGVGFAVSLYLIFAGSGQVPALPWVGAIASGAFLIVRYLFPARIEIWPDRFAWRGMLPVRHEYAFAEIDEFAVSFASHDNWTVGFRLIDSSPRRRVVGAVAKAVTGFHDGIDGMWELPPDRLADLLNRSKLRPSAWR